MTGSKRKKTLKFVFNALVKQGGPSAKTGRGEDTVCLYRGPDGRKCGIGLLITDAEYKPTWDVRKLPVGSLPERVRSALAKRSGLSGTDMRQLQRAHDWAAEQVVGVPHAWKELLREQFDEKFPGWDKEEPACP